MAQQPKPGPASLFTDPFTLLCFSMFLGYANHWIFMPAIPLYVDSLGGSATVARLALLAFSVPSFTVRPFGGRMADRWSAAGVLAIGLALLALGSLMLLFPFLVIVFVALGSSLVGSTTTALAMDLVNPQSRGRGMATYSVLHQIGAGIGAIISGALVDAFGLRAMYAGSIAIIIAGLAILVGTWRLLPRPAKKDVVMK
jgi:MFS family permease